MTTKKNKGDQARRAAGAPTGGRFAAQAKDESGVSLEPVDPGPGSAGSPEFDDGGDLEMDVALESADSDQLWAAVRHPNESVRFAATYNPNLSPEQVNELMNPAQPLSIRVWAARNHPSANAAALRDRDPFVRAWAQEGPRRQVSGTNADTAQDKQVAHLRHLMGGLLPVDRFTRLAS